ncbi:flippase [Thermococcus thioreducens]|uniref:Membrane protein involved in the export of O-antigen and teichoic acid n=1 Tax=Thermococcus thioreducens TaxID=277988 RepID=A0A0Q2UME9_9EURY|nr:flippase [Thermococcus thioreducens]ASJ11578.1 polysaccharide biosynthesis protein [Thermococcus thioreducens]KQH81816.1 polysaccharide biosynthesis protein [Thermococcus thioreducens]SEW04138.1 Membrane protein involved in the export of O-antigen and teichoic acid [Thermococcus thioreducens]
MDETSQALQKIARGTGIVSFGTVFWLFFEFLSRTIIARHYSTSEYGVFNLSLTVLSIALVIATLGFQNSLPREVAFYREREPSRVSDLISTASIIVALNSIIWTIILILGAEDIAQIFNEMRLAYALKIIAFALPFLALIGVTISISQGFGRVREKVYFQNIIYPTLFLVLVLVGTFLNFPFTFVFFVYVVAQAFTLLALIFDVWRVRLFGFRISLNLKIGSGLVVFSLPLLFMGILIFVMNWTDTLMLGYYSSSEAVGLYNAASPLAKLIQIFLISAGFIYVPIASQLYAQGRIEEIGRVYQLLTKWIFVLTLPLFSIVFLFPRTTINFFFGTKYAEASSALRILALGFMCHTLMGPNGWSLIIIGETVFNMVGDLFAAITNIVLNVILIPLYGIEGAAMSTAVSYFVANVFRSFWLYKRTKIHPFSWNYAKLLVISFVLLGIIQTIHLRVSNIWYEILILVIFLLVYLFLSLLSRSVDKEDVELFLAIEKKLRIELKIIKRTLRKFV